MTVYTVHEPPPRDDDSIATDASRFVFVRDGFHFWAFVFAPLWMVWRGLWLTVLAYLVAMTAVQAGLWGLGVSGSARCAVTLLIHLLIGFEAGSLRRWTLHRRGWRNLGAVVARNLETAEWRFFNAWTGRPDGPSAAARPPGVAAPRPMPQPASRRAEPDVIGLFPEPEPRR